MTPQKDYINQPLIREENFKREQYIISIKFIKKEKIELTERRLLDFGCGNGEFSEYLSSKGAIVDCYEPNKNSRKILRKKGLKVIKNLKKNNYDGVFSLEVIEHLIDPKKMIIKIHNTLKKGGFIFITTPNHLYWKLRIKCLLGDIKAFEYPNKHFSFFTKKSLKKLMEKYFKTIKIENIGSKIVYYGKKE